MSGLEIIALLPTIVSAFGAISVEYREWRKQRADRAHKRKNLHLQKFLAGNVAAVQGEFDEGLRAVGPALRQGDVIARENLMNHLIILQSTVISLLRDQQNDASHLIHPNHDSIHSTTSSTRDGIVTALSEQCQRLAQAKPIPRIQGSALRTPTHSTGNCLNALKYEYVESATNPLLFGGLGVLLTVRVSRNSNHYSFSCGSCNWFGMYVESWPIPMTKEGRWLDVKLVLDRFHYFDTTKWNNGMTFRCYICSEYLFGDRAEGRWRKVVRHIREKHCLEEFQPL
ncbi:hypothetical protein BJY00DRAFT_282758 [Aspergillus carlsbadensis]|nr:hypothetical protein BJY00DRAFT_282758 [Aspergillus carlsbadensis]